MAEALEGGSFWWRSRRPLLTTRRPDRWSWWMEPLRRMRRALLKSLGGARLRPRPFRRPRGGPAGLGLRWGSGRRSVGQPGKFTDWSMPSRRSRAARSSSTGTSSPACAGARSRKSLDVLAPDAEQVVLRLMFDDARHPEFELALWDADPAGADQFAGRGPASGPALVVASRGDAERLIRDRAFLSRADGTLEAPLIPVSTPLSRSAPVARLFDAYIIADWTAAEGKKLGDQSRCGSAWPSATCVSASTRRPITSRRAPRARPCWRRMLAEHRKRGDRVLVGLRLQLRLSRRALPSG